VLLSVKSVSLSGKSMNLFMNFITGKAKSKYSPVNFNELIIYLKDSLHIIILEKQC